MSWLPDDDAIGAEFRALRRYLVLWAKKAVPLDSPEAYLDRAQSEAGAAQAAPNDNVCHERYFNCACAASLGAFAVAIATRRNTSPEAEMRYLLESIHATTRQVSQIKAERDARMLRALTQTREGLISDLVGASEDFVEVAAVALAGAASGTE